MAFNEDKYKKIFEQRFGAGSFDSALSSARSIGKTKAQAEFAKKDYMMRFNEAKKEAKKRQKEQEEYELYGGQSKKSWQAENAAQGKITKQQEKAQAQGRGGHLPTRENAEKERKATEKAKKESAFKDFESMTPYARQQYLAEQEEKTKKKEDKNLFGGLIDKVKKSEVGRAVKAAEDFFNPFDNVKAKDAVKSYLNHEQSDSFKEFARGANRAVDSTTLGAMSNLDKKLNDRDPYYNTKREFGEGGGTDMITSGIGYLVPGVGAYKALNATKAGNALTQFGLKGVGQRLASEAAKGSIAGAAMSSTEVGIREGLNPKDYNWKQNAALIGIGTAGGAIADPLLYGAGKGVMNGLSKFAKGDVPTFSGGPSQATIDKLAPNVPKNANDIMRNLQPNAESKPFNAMNDLGLPARREVASAAEQVRPGRDFEPIEQGAEPPPLARVAEELLDTQRQATGDINSFRARVDRTPKKNEGGLFSNLRTQFIDDVAPLETLEKQITGNIGSAENSLYKQARLFKGSPEKANLIVKEQLEPIIRDLQKNGLKMDDLGDYALAVHARDVNEKGINSGFTNAEIEDVIAKLGTEQMEAARKKLIGANNSVLDMLSKGGILNSADVAAMKEKWPNYVSLFRSFDDDKIEFASGISKALANASSPIKKLEGSNRAVIDPMESVVKNIFKATNTVDRNNVAKQIGKLAEQDTEGNFIKRLADKDDTSRMNVISVMEDGKKVKYEVPPEVYRTMMNLDKESTNTLIKILQKPASWLRGGATLTPEFSLRNPLRDVPNAFVVSESGFNPVVDFPIGLWQSIWKGRTIKIGNKEFKTSGELYKQFLKGNGGYGNIISMDRELHRDTLKKALLDANTDYFDVLSPKSYAALMKKYANPKHPLASLRNIADVSETATKVGEFRAALKKGATPQEAAYRARDIMDFARAGVSVREANKVVAFLNANIQGKSKLFRAFKENPAKVTGKAVAAVTIPAIGAIIAQNTYANDKQREILDDAPQWLKDTFFLVPIPGTNQIARIPKPFDLAYPFANTIERAFDFAYKNDKEAFDGFIKQAFSAASVPVMLTGIAPIVEGMANYSFFRQGPIIPKREESMNFPDQYDVNTTETAKLIGKGVNKITGGEGAFKNFGSPRVIDNSIQGFFGGLGTYSASAADGVINYFIDNTGKPEKPTKNIDQKPLARAFLVNQSSGGESLDTIYSLKDKLTKERGSAKQNNVPFKDEVKYKTVNEMTKQLSEINKQIRFVENNPSLSADQKRSMLDELIKQRTTFARMAAEQTKGWK